jgi:hypothetical protein
MNTYNVSMTYRTALKGWRTVSHEIQGLNCDDAARYCAKQYPGEEGETLIICGATENDLISPVRARLAEMLEGGES